jgi:hypothetical protein
METSNPAPRSESRLGYWFRVLRPLTWWLLLVLVMYGIRLHQRWMAQTKLKFSVTVNGRDDYSMPTATLDDQYAHSGQLMSLGSHQFVITHPKGVTFTTNLFTWYGGNDFGRIDLKRKTGTLWIEAKPPADSLKIHGPEYELTLWNSSGTNLTVPTDDYVITATYAFSEERATAEVSTYMTATVSIKPDFGAAVLESDPAGASVTDDNGRTLGTTPLIVQQLKPGGRKFTLERENDETVVADLFISANQTNHFKTSLVNRYYAAALRSAQGHFAAGRYAEAALAAGRGAQIPTGRYHGHGPAPAGHRAEPSGAGPDGGRRRKPGPSHRRTESGPEIHPRPCGRQAVAGGVYPTGSRPDRRRTEAGGGTGRAGTAAAGSRPD